ncbi:MAG: hypothetical protein K9M75_03550 [Phycisphaerae bacterium]|nr:hypothetical protein [Phycisphaerae bacterium]
MTNKRRRGPINKQTQAAPAGETKISKINFTGFSKYYIYLVVAILAGLPFLVGKYIEFNTPGPFDSGSYVYSAQHIAEGAKLFVDEIPSAKPMTLLVNFIGVKLCGFSETGPILVQGMLQLGAFVMMFIAVRKMCGSIAAVISVTIAAIYLSSPLVAKFGNVKEQFMISFMIISASCFILRQLGGKWWWAILTGAAAINVYYFKPTGLSVIVAIVVYMIVSIAVAPKKWRAVANDFVLIIAGGFVGLLPLYIFYRWQNALPSFYDSLPVSVLMDLLKLSVLGVVVYMLVRLAIYADLLANLKKIRQVRKPIWICGAVAIAVLFIPCTYFFHSRVIVDVQFKPIENTGYMKYYDPGQIAAELQEIERVGYIDYYKSLGNRTKGKVIPLKKGGELDSYINSISFVKYPKKIIAYPVTAVKGIADKFGYLASKAAGADGYIGESRKVLDLSAQSKKVFRFYLALKLPILMALASIAAGIFVLLLRVAGKKKQTTIADRLVIFLAVWWIFDMVFVWISPRSYEQYYLPLIASASVLAGYVCSFYSAKLKAASNKLPWYGAGAFAVFVMLIMSLHIFFGLSRSPHSREKYKRQTSTGSVEYYKRFGFVQALDRVKQSKAGNIGGWERVGLYIKEHSTEDDRIYVWGWYPGIYVKAQRLSSAKKAFESEMHVKSPKTLKKEISNLLSAFKENPPEFIVDSRKSHFPWTRFPFELWPTTTNGLLPNQQRIIEKYDADVTKMIVEQLGAKFGKKFGKDEAERYKEMGAFRKFVMDNYEPVQQTGYAQTPQGRKPVDMFAPHRVFKLKSHQGK